MTERNTDYAAHPADIALSELLQAIERMDQKLTSNEGGFHAAEDSDGFISRYTMPVGPWHRVLGLARGTNWPHHQAKRDAELARLRAENEALAKFKVYVHKRLDDAGIPADPESPHKAEGCRIGGRLDIVLADAAAKAQEVTGG